MAKINADTFANSNPIAWSGTLDNGSEVTLRKPTQADLDFVTGGADGSEDRVYARFVVACLANEDGSRVFKYTDLDKVAGYFVEDIKPIALEIRRRCFDKIADPDTVEKN